MALAAAAATASPRQALPSSARPLQQGVPGYRLPAMQLPSDDWNSAKASPWQEPLLDGDAGRVAGPNMGPWLPDVVPQPERSSVLQPGGTSGDNVRLQRHETGVGTWANAGSVAGRAWAV